MDERLTEKIEYLMDKNQGKIIEFVKHMYNYDPDAVEKMLNYSKMEDNHITNRRKYDELVEKLKWTDGGRGAKWSFDDIKKNSKIDFSRVDFTEYDYAYLVNMLYAKCHKYITDPSIYLKMAKSLLEDNDEETKIYHGAFSKKHQHHGTQAYYNEYTPYDEEDRRRRRTRSEYDEYDGYDEENRRGVRRYRNESPMHNDDRFDRTYPDNERGFFR